MSIERRSPSAPSDCTDDAVLGGRLRLLQPRRGHRVGHDAILLAAATPAGAFAVDLGAGVGAAGLALALRDSRMAVRLVEIDPVLVALARDNAERNGLAGQVKAIALDVGAPADDFAAAGLPAAVADRVLMNPPFNDPQRRVASPDPARRAAHSASLATLTTWVATAARLLRPGGVLTMIYRADDLERVLTAVAPEFGGVAVLPVFPKPEAAAIRVLVRAVKGSAAPLSLLPGLVLQDADGKPSAAAEAVLRDGGVLPLAMLE